MKAKEIANKIYYVGVNDRSKSLFENLWPLPHGVSYNSYLIMDEKATLVDTVDASFSDIYLQRLSDILGDRPLEYLIVNHMEPDHSGSIRQLRRQYPGMKIVGNGKTFGMLDGFYGIKDGLHEVKDGDSLPIGSRSLFFHTAPMVHWPEVMFTYDAVSKVLFSADAFGTYGTLDGGIIDDELLLDGFWDEMERYYSNIVGKYGSPVQKAINKVSSLDIQMICSTHGPVWKRYINDAVSVYERMSRYEGKSGATIVYGSMYGHTEQMAEAVATSLVEHGIKNIAMHNASRSHSSYILRDVFKYRGLIVGSPTYSNQLFPEIESLLMKVETRDVKNRLFGIFGTFTWAGAAVKKLEEYALRMKWETVGSAVEQKQGMTADTYNRCLELGKLMAQKLNDN
ncbi:MAG: FprA family A-type flavoprotein [Tannerellaceae bacterium]|jgi:flavorubredoxin|nr:FprA family A-type flavoprotein [Tannerellaceae bacterium]